MFTNHKPTRRSQSLNCELKPQVYNFFTIHYSSPLPLIAELCGILVRLRCSTEAYCSPYRKIVPVGLHLIA
jgi:hypothetical protein